MGKLGRTNHEENATLQNVLREKIFNEFFFSWSDFSSRSFIFYCILTETLPVMKPEVRHLSPTVTPQGPLE